MKPRRSPYAQPIVDVDLDIVAAGQTSTAPAAQVATGQSGPGHLLVTNPDATNTVYIAGGDAGIPDATKFVLLPQQTLSLRLANVAALSAYSASNVSVAWMVLR